jgi:hypothetical protein
LVTARGKIGAKRFLFQTYPDKRVNISPLLWISER